MTPVSRNEVIDKLTEILTERFRGAEVLASRESGLQAYRYNGTLFANEADVVIRRHFIGPQASDIAFVVTSSNRVRYLLEDRNRDHGFDWNWGEGIARQVSDSLAPRSEETPIVAGEPEPPGEPEPGVEPPPADTYNEFPIDRPTDDADPVRDSDGDGDEDDGDDDGNMLVH